jgi:hypothetical protein
MNPRRNGDARFRVTILDPAEKQLAAITRQAQQVGRGADVRVAFQVIRQRLQMDARGFGEATGRFTHADLQIRRGAVAPLFVYYGVHQTEPEVFVREFRALL